MPKELERYLQMKVRSGRFASEDEAIVEAVRLLQQKEDAEPTTEAEVPDSKAVPAWKRVLEIMGQVPEDVFTRIPADSSKQLDYYLDGTPKRQTP